MAQREHINDDGDILRCSTTPDNCDFSRNGDHLEPNSSPEEVKRFYEQAEKVAQKAAGNSSVVASSKKGRKKPSSLSNNFDSIDNLQNNLYANEEHPDDEDVDLYPVTVFSMKTPEGELRRVGFYDGSSISIEKKRNGKNSYAESDKNGETIAKGDLADESETAKLEEKIKHKAYQARGEAEFDDSSARIKSMAGKVDPNFRVAVHPKQMTDPSGGADRLVNVQGKTGGFFFIQKSSKDLDGNDKHFYGVVDNDTEDEPAYMKDDTRKSVEKMTARYLVAQKAKDDANDTTGDVHDYMMGFRKEPLLQGDE